VASLKINQAYTGGDYGRTATANAQPFKGIVFHVTGRPTLQSEMDYMSKPDPNRPGYYGYHYLIDRDGSVYQTAPDNVRTNHVMPNSQYGLNNSNALGVSMVAGHAVNGNIITTPEQIAAGKQLADQLRSQYHIPANMVVSHSMLDQATRGPGHGLGASADVGEGDDFISAYNKGAVAPTATASVAPGQPSRPGTPTPGAQFRSPFDVVTGVESSGQNVNQQIKDKNYDPTTGRGNPARGYFQIIDPTWREFAAKAGVDISKYPTALDAPKDVQAQVAGVIPIARWGPDSQAALKKAGYSWTGNQTLGSLQSGAINPPATPGTSITSTAVPAGSGAILPGFSDQATSDKFAKSATDFSQAMGGGGDQSGQGQQPPQMPPMPQTPFGGRNVGPLGGAMVGAPMFDPRMAAASYGTLLNSIGNMQPPPANPTAAAPGAQPGAPPGAGYGPQGQQAGLMPTGLTAMQYANLSPYALGQQQQPYGTSMTSLGGY
jgi:N-acetyl-anhydromuramyl-L-alanine amidase AmpD